MSIISPTYKPDTNRYFDGKANYEVSGQWKFDIVPEGLPTGLFDPSLSYIFTGDETFNGGFNVNSPLSTSIFSGDFLNLGSVNDVNISSNTQQVNINANNGNVNIHGKSGTLNTDNGLNIYTIGGDLNVNTSNGNFNLFAGTGPTPGQINIGAYQQISIFSQTQTLSLNANDPANGTVSMNGAAGSWSVGVSGIAGGVGIGAGCTVDSTTGNVQLGTSVGSVLMGSLASTVDILANTVLTLTGSTKIDLASSNVTLSLVTDQAPVVASPTISLPVGYKYLIVSDSSGQVYKMG